MTRRYEDPVAMLRRLDAQVRDLEARMGKLGEARGDLDALLSATHSTTNVSHTTTSTTYADLTDGPELTVATGDYVVVVLVAHMSNSTAGQGCYMDFAVSGDTTRAATDNTAVHFTSATANGSARITALNPITVTAGSNTFTSKYRVTGGTGTFQRRRLFVIPFGAA